ncbi:MaoC family dehydratase [uncultured Acinetobacter sp.]|uniref:MaoC family dehydratase n=1 Tax=uncultured Acinetobacter sp. TaxID=165433 RepID=UPI002615D037|nr:MaoC family dehydratase [uncultured Acinetobacter sp.]
MLKNFSIDELGIGMKASSTHLVTEEKVKLFSEISGDYNPVHLDEVYAKSTRFEKRIAHGMLVSSFISSLFAMQLPGPGCIYISQSLLFKKPVFINDMVTAEVEITAIDTVKNRVMFETRCYVDKVIVLQGNAEIFIPKV